MADVFISYSREDHERATEISAVIEELGYSIWWDREIVGGSEFSNAIQQEIEASAAVVVLWSKNAVSSPWVRDEASLARDQGKLISLLLDEEKPPLGFQQYQTIDFQMRLGDQRKTAKEKLRLALMSKKHAPMRTVQSKSRAKGKHFKRIFDNPKLIMGAVTGLTAVMVVLISLYYFLADGDHFRLEPRVSVHEASIAIVPFGASNADSITKELASALSYDLQTLLSSSQVLRVMSIDSANSLAEQDYTAQEIGRRLGVAYVLSGDFRSRGEDYRLAVQLTESKSGFDVWGDIIAGNESDIISLTEKLALLVTEKISGGEGDSSKTTYDAGTENSVAYSKFIRARVALKARGRRLLDAISLFEDAIEDDPRFGRAYSGLAVAHSLSGYWLGVDELQAKNLARDYARQAILVDQENAEALSVLAADFNFRGNGVESIKLYEKAYTLDPNDTITAAWYSNVLIALGYFDEGLTIADRSVERDPGSAYFRSIHALANYYLGNYKQAQESAKASLALGDAPRFSHIILTFIAVEEHRLEDAQMHLTEFYSDTFSGDAETIDSFKISVMAFLKNEMSSTKLLEKFPELKTHLNFYRAIMVLDKDAQGLLDNIRMQKALSGLELLWANLAPEIRQDPYFKVFVENNLMVADIWRMRGFPPRCREIGEVDFECA